MRFARTRLLVGEEGATRLARSRVAVYGLGGVGGYAFEALVRAGVGHLYIVDFDVVDPTNLNRQILALESTLGRPKVEVAVERARQINPAVEIEAIRGFITTKSVEDFIPADLAYAVEAIDALSPKSALIAALHRRGVPFIACMGAASRLSPAEIHVGDLNEVRYCPLARRVRQRLRKQGIDGNVRCVYSLEPPKGELDAAEGTDALDPTLGRTRMVRGTISYLPGLVGLMAAGEVIQELLTDA